uniref:Uncharacterized protein n=1 Tax=Lactuca sativa TaxID=4236 RepID=A0A9R1XTI3_LACSA|nr:hypothetical protein LSAT_V11C100029950 [Lactuca sativa]
MGPTGSRNILEQVVATTTLTLLPFPYNTDPQELQRWSFHQWRLHLQSHLAPLFSSARKMRACLHSPHNHPNRSKYPRKKYRGRSYPSWHHDNLNENHPRLVQLGFFLYSFYYLCFYCHESVNYRSIW